jgi:hypothetical protein
MGEDKHALTLSTEELRVMCIALRSAMNHSREYCETYEWRTMAELKDRLIKLCDEYLIKLSKPRLI